MGRRRKFKEMNIGGSGGTTASDIMTSLIGVMILVLIGILLTTIITQAIVVIADPNTKDVVSVLTSEVDGFPESKAFPHGNKDVEPVYVEVFRDHILIHPKNLVLTQRDLALKGNLLALEIDRVASDAVKSYFVLMVRPGGAQVARALRTEIRKRGVEVGVDLLESTRQMTHVSQTTEARRKMMEAINRRNKGGGAAPGSPAPVTPAPSVPPASTPSPPAAT
jgi:hypothetical protein